ncbi:MAG: 16S rRNA (cytidine(1402)-2'-O)-methyltransferase [Bryobacteraceae bacterium]
MPASLYLVATPIGNLEDITYRAVRTLSEAGLIACEDTRQTRKLLDHYRISTPLVSYHEHNEKARAAELVERLAAGQSIALVSDAGTPLVSDPGFRLVEQAIANGIPVVPIPGPSAAIAALAASGLPVDAFRFGGFLPPKSGARRRELERLAGAAETLIFYEAPHRLAETLADVVETLGPTRPVAVGRELTKLHEEFLRGTAGEVAALAAAREPLKGEITLLIGRAAGPPAPAGPDEIRAEIESLVRGGASAMDAMKEVARSHGIGKRDVYRIWEDH